MKITKDQANTIHTMAMQEASNAQIAEATGLPLSEIYAYRSRNNITRDKVRQLLGLGSKKRVKKSKAESANLDPVLNAIIRKCGGKLEPVVEYILATVQEDGVCKHCQLDECGDLIACAAATAAVLRERDGNA